jgi:hypothetical protein
MSASGATCFDANSRKVHIVNGGGYRLRPNADLMIKSSSCAACRRLVASGDLTSLKAVSASRTFIVRARITVTGADIGTTGAAIPCDRHSGEQYASGQVTSLRQHKQFAFVMNSSVVHDGR